MKQFILVILFAGLAIASYAQIQEVPYTLDDRDRVIRVEARMEAVEAKIEALETKMDVKFESVNARIDYLFWLIGFIAMLIIFMLGYMIWDRRTALKPALEKAATADDKSQNILLALRDFARKNADLAEVMRSHGLL